MSRLKRIMLLVLAMSLTLTGCKDRVDLENITLVLMEGLDLDKDNNLLVYISSPVFNKEAKKQNEATKVKAISPRDSRGYLEAKVSALVSTGKLQNLLISKKLLQQPYWYKLLDVFFRDAKVRANARIIMVDGNVGDVVFFEPDDKRRLPLHIAKLVDTAHERNLVEMTTLFTIQRLIYEKGVTPYITELRKEPKEIRLMGTALLDKKGKYVTSINLVENELLQILQDEKFQDLTLTVVLPEKDKPGTVFHMGTVSFYVKKVNRKIRTSYKDGRFQFTFDIGLPIQITERLFDYDVQDDAHKLEKMINEQLDNKLRELVGKFQKNKVDPIGLGLFARAYQYHNWKKVQNDWPEAFAEAKIDVHAHTSIKDYGEIK
ncbi:Ger(x)C family spore germination protein [Paenibacillus sp. OV219]|uniref:Ger(x)C family spore germination protein n=1 Tax=Paenibacillus sp. OV219 TaxID=1884377 RepID=UPI0008D2E2E5|nr:Ger(x)C family spore germination protein [Paenibacillus sp. OV219]SEM91066.1 germination protein, Ger(x)C family [Paenibacillus sp. OV219]